MPPLCSRSSSAGRFFAHSQSQSRSLSLSLAAARRPLSSTARWPPSADQSSLAAIKVRQWQPFSEANLSRLLSCSHAVHCSLSLSLSLSLARHNKRLFRQANFANLKLAEIQLFPISNFPNFPTFATFLAGTMQPPGSTEARPKVELSPDLSRSALSAQVWEILARISSTKRLTSFHCTSTAMGRLFSKNFPENFQVAGGSSCVTATRTTVFQTKAARTSENKLKVNTDTNKLSVSGCPLCSLRVMSWRRRSRARR